VGGGNSILHFLDNLPTANSRSVSLGTGQIVDSVIHRLVKFVEMFSREIGL